MNPTSLDAASRGPIDPAHRPRCAAHALLLDDRGRCVRCDDATVKADERRILSTLGRVAIAAFALLAGAAIYRVASAERPAASSREPASGVRIVVFGANWCGSCRAAKSWLTENGYEFEWHNVDDPATAPRLQSQAKLRPGRTTIPVIGVDGDYVQGFNADGLQRRIQAAKEHRTTSETGGG